MRLTYGPFAWVFASGADKMASDLANIFNDEEAGSDRANSITSSDLDPFLLQGALFPGRPGSGLSLFRQPITEPHSRVQIGRCHMPVLVVLEQATAWTLVIRKRFGA